MPDEKKEFIKPRCKLVGEDGNVFNLMGLASGALKRAGYMEQSKEMYDKIFNEAHSYSKALAIIMEYVEVH